MRRRPTNGAALAVALLLGAAACSAATPQGEPAPPGRSASTGRPTPTSSADPAAAARGALPPSTTPSARPTVPSASSAAWLPAPTGKGHLAPGSDPSVLPGPILIADKHNNRVIIVDPQGRVRWQFPRPGDLRHGQTFKIPDDAFFSPDGREIIATEEDDYVISVIDIATHRLVYRYGTPGTPGHTPNHLNNPDDAMLLPDGSVLTADIKNCRLLLVAKGAHTPAKTIGRAVRPCRHDPPTRWGSPNGAFPMRNGDWLVTEINGDWVSELSPGGKVLWSAHPAGLTYPSDSNEISPGRYLTVDYRNPGTVLIFDRHGKTLWRYHPAGAHALHRPSLAVPLPNGMVLLNDDDNHRVIVVDPRTSRVVWQYGHTGKAGRAPGYLNTPDGLDPLPPYSLLTTHAGTLRAP